MRMNRLQYAYDNANPYDDEPTHAECEECGNPFNLDDYFDCPECEEE